MGGCVIDTLTISQVHGHRDGHPCLTAPSTCLLSETLEAQSFAPLSADGFRMMLFGRKALHHIFPRVWFLPLLTHACYILFLALARLGRAAPTTEFATA